MHLIIFILAFLDQQRMQTLKYMELNISTFLSNVILSLLMHNIVQQFICMVIFFCVPPWTKREMDNVMMTLALLSISSMCFPSLLQYSLCIPFLFVRICLFVMPSSLGIHQVGKMNSIIASHRGVTCSQIVDIPFHQTKSYFPIFYT